MTGVDLDGLHVLLWKQADRRHHTVRIQQNRFCEDLDLSRFTLNKILRRLEADGRVESLSPSRGATVKTYRIVEPQRWWQEHGYVFDDPDAHAQPAL